MIPTIHEVACALRGTYRLARGDRRGADDFEDGPEAALRSFWVALAVFPPSMAMVVLQRWSQFDDISATRILVVEMISYVIDWVAFPLAMFYFAASIGRSQQFFRYLTAYNWAGLPQLALSIPVVVIGQTDLLDDGLTTLIVMVLILLLLAYHWFIARAVLEVSEGMAVGVVALDTLLVFIVSQATDSLVLG
ncbi:MAG: hypothetical protein P4M00_03005 [Azospirillaceae bacterium]|nr:hypothetical protein [Azospirillaceae bacterium]